MDRRTSLRFAMLVDAIAFALILLLGLYLALAARRD